MTWSFPCSSERASVTVVIPCYNSASTLPRALTSVFEQSLLPEKIILVNDGSTDNTRNIITSLQETYGKEWLYLIDLCENQGPSHARNEGVRLANTDYIAFLDADDTWHPRKLEIQYNWMLSHPYVSLSGHKAEVALFDKLPEITLPTELRVKHISKWKALLSNPFSTPTVMMKKKEGHDFEVGHHHAEDYLCWLKICLSGELVYRLEISLAFIHKAAYSEAGLSESLLKMEKGELRTFREIYKGGYVNFFVYSGLIVYSLMKFLRRVFLTGISRHTARRH
jgi:glycosyltransferase involved in cell wall biosynthesis